MLNKKSMELSILDFGETELPDESLQDILDYAITAEHVGFKRFWLGEHYGRNSLFNNPEPLLPAVAMVTEKIFVGTAGLLARQHAIHRVACSFSLLEKMFPGRIDLGLVVPVSLSNNGETPLLTESTAEIFASYTELFELGSDSKGVFVNSAPAVWQLTSSFNNYLSCRHLGPVNVSKTLFHANANFEAETDVILAINELHQQSGRSAPAITVAIACFVSADPHRLRECREFHRQILAPVVFKHSVIESPEIFRERILQLMHKYHTHDIIILNLARSYAEKSQCLQTISSILNLQDAYSSK
jgi:alkanesulfonate monooxygenase SsuD/methylene tetrahydromethanopterin reductase-like flavin-dependent oxidoreductase (luciferase family)